MAESTLPHSIGMGVSWICGMLVQRQRKSRCQHSSLYQRTLNHICIESLNLDNQMVITNYTIYSIPLFPGCRHQTTLYTWMHWPISCELLSLVKSPTDVLTPNGMQIRPQLRLSHIWRRWQGSFRGSKEYHPAFLMFINWPHMHGPKWPLPSLARMANISRSTQNPEACISWFKPQDTNGVRSCEIDPWLTRAERHKTDHAVESAWCGGKLNHVKSLVYWQNHCLMKLM